MCEPMGNEDIRVEFAVLKNSLDNLATEVRQSRSDLAGKLGDHEGRLRIIERDIQSETERRNQTKMLENHDRIIQRLDANLETLTKQVDLGDTAMREHEEHHRRITVAIYGVFIGLLVEGVLIAAQLAGGIP